MAFGKPHILWLCTIAYLLPNWGCHLQQTAFSDKDAQLPLINKVVVVGFKAALSPGEEPGVFRDPLSGAIFMAEPVPQAVVQRMSDILFARLVADNRYELISPSQAKGAISSIVHSDQNVEIGPQRILQEIGKIFVADAVLTGHVYRWEERQGTDYAVKRSASVAFDLHLVGPKGEILWRAKFDKTQRSLSENVFDLETFLQSGGRWMVVEELALMGLQELLEKMPEGK
jgi:hypothetical protein